MTVVCFFTHTQAMLNKLVCHSMFLAKTKDRFIILTLSPFLLPSATRITVLLLLRSCDLLCIGTEGGGVYFLELPSLSLKDDKTLLQDQVMQR